MNPTKEIDTEQRIFEAAQMVFLQKGLADTTMQDIANQAGISRTSLHYYFRNKEKLFEGILSQALDNVLPKINQTINKEIPLVEKIIEIAHNYLDLLNNNEQLPGFITLELRRDPDLVIGYIIKRSTTINFDVVEKQMRIEIAEGKVREFDLSQMVISVVGLCVFPFICKPVLDNLFLFKQDVDFNSFITERKTVVAEIISNWLTIKN